ncbi:MAG TPA: ribbon-helix-helix protein, CopG family [Acidilobales archaeon]|nr:ribbon-helix-helix protein, CopG family [Acidilobales archaeon]
MKTSVISFKIDITVLRKIERLVTNGYFRNKSEFIREAILYKLAKDGLLKSE